MQSPKSEERATFFKNFTNQEFEEYHSILEKKFLKKSGLTKEEEERFDQLCLKLERPMHEGRQ